MTVSILKILRNCAVKICSSLHVSQKDCSRILLVIQDLIMFIALYFLRQRSKFKMCKRFSSTPEKSKKSLRLAVDWFFFPLYFHTTVGPPWLPKCSDLSPPFLSMLSWSLFVLSFGRGPTRRPGCSIWPLKEQGVLYTFEWRPCLLKNGTQFQCLPSSFRERQG